MSIFGWDYPAGCSSTPYDADDPPCECCGKFVDICICPECSTCGELGDPKCYSEHGMIYTKEQLIGQTNLQIMELENEVHDRKLYLEWLEQKDLLTDP